MGIVCSMLITKPWFVLDFLASVFKMISIFAVSQQNTLLVRLLIMKNIYIKGPSLGLPFRMEINVNQGILVSASFLSRYYLKIISYLWLYEKQLSLLARCQNRILFLLLVMSQAASVERIWYDIVQDIPTLVTIRRENLARVSERSLGTSSLNDHISGSTAWKH